MCGIVGTHGWADEQQLGEMLDWIGHRGPDEQGRYVDHGADLAMGARRLSIVDLSSGSQPMWNEDETVGVVFNGEIYNHRDLREGLRRRGHTFASDCDTEVLVHLWEEHGEALVDRLRGMFAFAIWDRQAETVFLARDRIGIKPLFYAHTDRGLAWASEIQPLLAAGVDRTLSPRAVYEHFAYEYTPRPQTLFRAIRKVPPGHTLTVDSDGIRERQYWSPLGTNPGSTSTSVDDAVSRVSELLHQSVENRLMADVPVGAFLSGGLDSSAVVAIASEIRDEPLRTYSVSFESSEIDESEHARFVADHFGTDHHEVDVDLSSLDLFGDMVRHLGEPTGHLQMLPIFELSRRASEDVKVALAGEGADELFGGYHYYQNVPNRKRAVDFVPARLHDAADVLAPHVPVKQEYVTQLAGLKSDASAIQHTACRSLSPRPTADELSDVPGTARSAPLDGPARTVTKRVPDAPLEQQLSLFEVQYKLPNSVLYKTDHASMSASIEVRVPFLSKAMVEYALSLPVEHKVTPEQVKHVLKRAVRDVVPEEIIERKKHAMRMPTQELFRDEHEAIEVWFTEDKLRQAEFIDERWALELRDAHRSGERDVGQSLWTILTYVAWYHTFVDPRNAIV
jgi:asparagine synthase (glutamine-hydrolysing)